ncbi:MAG: acetate--CoA ligase family protein, partial [Chloroflexota bacterium]
AGVDHMASLETPGVPMKELGDVDPHLARSILSEYGSGEIISPEDTFRLLDAYGVPTLQPQLSKTPRQAARLAEDLGYPVALKIASPQITHKSDVGGVRLQLKNSQEVEASFKQIVENSQAAFPEAEILGVYIQRMLPPGQDVIIGAIQDPQFGALVMFGSGGIEVEGLKDVEFALAPLSRAESVQLIKNTWAGRKLSGYRSLSPADQSAVVDIITRIALLASDFPQLAEIEINPLTVQEEGQGAHAVDVRAKTGINHDPILQ